LKAQNPIAHPITVHKDYAWTTDIANLQRLLVEHVLELERAVRELQQR